MRRATWSPRARRDLRALLTYLRRRNPAAAERASQELLAAADQLVQFSGMGRPGSSSEKREKSVPAWHLVMVYRLLDGSIEISTLRDTRRGSAEQPED